LPFWFLFAAESLFANSAGLLLPDLFFKPATFGFGFAGLLLRGLFLKAEAFGLSFAGHLDDSLVRVVDTEFPKKPVDATGIVGAEVDVLLTLQTQRDFALDVQNGDDNLALLERVGDLVADVLRADGGGGQDDQHLGRGAEGAFDGVVPRVARFDIELV
jgi:hypothetical protein